MIIGENELTVHLYRNFHVAKVLNKTKTGVPPEIGMKVSQILKNLSYEIGIKKSTLNRVVYSSDFNIAFNDVDTKRKQHNLIPLSSYRKQLKKLYDDVRFSVLDGDEDEDVEAFFREDGKSLPSFTIEERNARDDSHRQNMFGRAKNKKLAKDQEKRVRKEKEKIRKDRRGPRQFEEMSASAMDAYQKISNKKFESRSGVHPRKKKQASKQLGYTKAEKKAFREQANLRKSEKKLARKARRAEDIKTESMHFADFVTLPRELQTFMDWMKSTRELRSVVVFLYQAYRSTSFLDYAACAHQYFLTLSINIEEADSVYKLHMAKYQKRSQEFFDRFPGDFCSSDIKTESLTENLEWFSSVAYKVVTSDVAQHVSELVLGLTSMKLFSKDISKKIWSTFGLPKKRMTFLEIGHSIFTALLNLLKFGEALASGAPWSSFLRSDDPVESACVEIEELIRFSTRIAYGLGHDGYIMSHEFMRRASEVLTISNDLLSRMATYHPDYKRLSKFRNEMDNIFIRERDFNNSKTRSPPVAVMIHGDPGVGKSLIVQAVVRSYCKVIGVEFSQGVIFNRCTTSTYWDGYNPFSQLVIHYSELGNKNPARVRSQGDACIEELCSVIDALPKTVDVAFEDKGKIRCAPKMVILDTNNPSLNAKEATSHPAAIARRFIYVEVVVKPEFRKDGSVEIDPSKASGNSDVWTFHVYRREANGAANSHKTNIFSTGSVVDFLSHLRELFIDHESRIAESSKASHDLSDTVEEVFSRPLSCDVDHKEGEDNLIFREFVPSSASAKRSRKKWVVKESRSLESKEHTCEAKGYDPDIRTESLHSFVQDRVPHKVRVLPLVLQTIMLQLFLWIVELFEPDKLSALIASTFFLFISMCMGINVVNFSLLILFMVAFVTHWIKSFRFSMIVDKLKEKVRQKFSHECRKLMFAIGKIKSPYIEKNSKTIASLAGVLAALGLLCYYIRRKRRDFMSEGSSFLERDPCAAALEAAEDKLGCGPSYVRIKSKVHESWNVRHCAPPPVHTSGIVSLWDAVRRNCRGAKVYHDNTCTATFVLGLKGGVAVINRHALGSFNEVTRVKISCSGYDVGEGTQFVDINVDPNFTVLVSGDLAFITTPGLRFIDITKHIGGDEPPSCSVNALIAACPVVATWVSNPGCLRDKYAPSESLVEAWQYEWKDHSAGLCGLPLLIERGNGSVIAGLHAGTGVRSIAVPLTKSLVCDSIDKVNDLSGLVPIISEGRLSLHDVLEAPLEKSPFKYERLQGCKYLGKLPLPTKINTKSNLTISPHWDRIGKVFSQYYPKVKQQFGPPLMKPKIGADEYISPWNIALKKLGKTTQPLDPFILKRVVTELKERIVKNLNGEGVAKLNPLSVKDAINGSRVDEFINRINASTSSGFGRRGPKSLHIPFVDEKEGVREPTESLKRDILEILNTFENGESANFIYTAQLKDEPRPIEKVKSGKTRVFYMSPLHALVVTRMMLSPFYSLMVEHGEVFCTAVGINMHSQADALFKRLRDFSDKWMAGDYGSFDQGMPYQIGQASNTIVYEVLKEFGYNESALLVVKGLLTENLHPLVNMNNDVFERPALQPSGKYATAEDNSLRGLVMLMYGFYADPRNSNLDFFEVVLPVTYGDDLICSVKPCVSDRFNNVSYSAVVVDIFGMDYTTADKKRVETPFDEIERVQFLKRSFNYHESIDMIVGALDPDSIYKALKWYLPSKNVTHREQFLATCFSMLWESFMHLDEPGFLSLRAELQDALVAEGFTREDVSNFPDWKDIRKRVVPEEIEATIETESLTVRVGDEECYTACFPVLCLDKYKKNREPIVSAAYAGNATLTFWCANDSELVKLKLELSAELERLEQELDEFKTPFDHISFGDFRKILILNDNQGMKLMRKKKRIMISRCADIRSTLDFINDKLNLSRKDLIFTESAEVGAMSSGTVNSGVEARNQNVLDVMGEEEKSYVGDNITDHYDGYVMEMDMCDYLARPVEIASFTLDENVDLSLELDVWDLYTKQPSVRAKLRNFAYFRGELHIRIACSGTPFHYGRVLGSYQPFPLSNDPLQASLANAGLLAGYRPLLINYLSQAKNSCTIDVRENKPIEIVCPFLSPRPMAPLFPTGNTVISAATSYPGMDEFGSLFLYTINQVKSTSATPSEVAFAVYAWIEDLQLGTNTATQIDITTESKHLDEREIGPVESIASKMVVGSRWLSYIPPIKPLAMASEMMFTGMRDIAAVFGFSKPTLNAEPKYVKPLAYSNGAQCIGYETGFKISVDPKQELTVDPRVLGGDEDEMSIRHIASRESYLTTFDWDSGSTPLSSPIFCCAVSPQLATHINTVTPPQDWIQPTAMAFASLPFAYWRGNIEFRLDIVCSAFHRGKLAVFFEPSLGQSPLINASIALNKQYMKIIDIQETQSVSFCVEWAFQRPWAQVPYSGLLKSAYGGSSVPNNGSRYWNGYIAVVPFTDLQSPDDSSISVNVFVRCPDLMVNFPTELNLPKDRNILTESRDIGTQTSSCLPLNESSARTDDICQRYFGEQVVSFRTLLKRFHTYDEFSVPADATTKKTIFHAAPVFPLNPLTYGSLIFSDLHLFNYLQLGYVGMRGGIRRRFRFYGLHDGSNATNCRVGLYGPERSVTRSTTITASNLPTTLSGYVGYNMHANGGVEVEFPFYSNNEFAFAFHYEPWGLGALALDEFWPMRYKMQRDVSEATGDISVEVQLAASDDFTFMRFNGAPYYTN
jgi:hypothetical protein